MRRVFTTTDATRFEAHDHVAWSGKGDGPLYALATGAFAAARAHGKRLLFLARDPDVTRLSALGDTETMVADGALQLRDVRDAYADTANTDAQRAAFEEEVRAATDEGYSGLCIVADNTIAASGTNDEFARWLAWEAVADALQSALPINGVCYFDAESVEAGRLEDIAALHPVCVRRASRAGVSARVRRRRVTLHGAVDAFNAAQMERILMSAPHLCAVDVDVSDAEFLDHHALLALDRAARDRRPVRVRGANATLRKVWSILRVDDAALDFC